MESCGACMDWLLGRTPSHAELLVTSKDLLFCLEEEKKTVTSLQDDVTSLSQNQQEHLAKIETLKNSLRIEKMQTEELRDDRNALAERQRSTEDNLCKLKSDLETVQRDLEQVKLSNEKLVFDNKNLQKSLDNEKVQHSSLLESHQSLKVDHTNLKSRMDVMERLICEKEMALTSLKKEKTTLEATISDKIEMGKPDDNKQQQQREVNFPQVTQDFVNISRQLTAGEMVENPVQCE